MHLSTVLLFASSATAFSLPDVSGILPLFNRRSTDLSARGSPACPAIWSQISKNLTSNFLENGQCNQKARSAIRLIFHDCGTWTTSQGATGGCDGSLVNNLAELGRNENKGLDGIAGYIRGMAGWYKVSVADLVVFAGNHAIVTCPGGPAVKTYIGRKDSTTAAPDGGLPDVNAEANSLFQLFQAKGYDAEGLAALLGAHSTSNQFNFNTSCSGASQDSTPGIWDVKYYAETTNPPAGVQVFPSDAKLAAHPEVGKQFAGFVNNQGKWNGKFADAMGKMALFGSGGNTANMADCTGVLPKTTNAKREMRGMPLFARRH